jgi:hypothetical protein
MALHFVALGVVVVVVEAVVAVVTHTNKTITKMEGRIGYKINKSK